MIYRQQRLLGTPAAALSLRSSHPAQVAVSALAAVVLGGLVVMSPKVAVGLVGVVALVTLAFVAPVANLVLIVFGTAIVPFVVQNAVGAGAGSAVPTDLMILAGLARSALVLGEVRLTLWQRRALLLVTAFLSVSVLQFTRGLAAAHDRGTAGSELRTLFAFCTLIIALPLLADPRQRRRLFVGLLVTGIALGLWGITQWVLDIGFEAGFGVREGVDRAPSGSGMLQGGLYGFPIAAVLAFAALNSRQVASRWARFGLSGVLALNLVSLLLTYERTFWVGTAIAFAFVIAKAGSSSRARALVSTPAVALFAVGLLLAPSPKALVAARERLYSIGEYETDNSFRYRILESQQVLGKIGASPIVGHGLGDTLVYARPGDQVATRDYHYTHNGYLWLAWKIGVPATIMLSAFIALAVSQRRRHTGAGLYAAMRDGSQACLLLLLLVNVTFPAFNTFGITAVMGLLLAVCFAPGPSSVGPAGGAGSVLRAEPVGVG